MIGLTVDILETFIAGLQLTGQIESLNRTTENTTLTLAANSETYHLRENMNLLVNGTAYKVISFIKDQEVTVEGVIKQAAEYQVPNPFYFHGTPLMTNGQINGKKPKQFPMVYLYEILREREKNIDSSIVRESDLRLFFLDTANFEDWTTDDHYSNRLIGLNCLVDFFIKTARNDRCQFELYETEFTRINHVNWGVFRDNKGHESKLFDEQCTGVELSFTLPLKNCFK